MSGGDEYRFRVRDDVARDLREAVARVPLRALAELRAELTHVAQPIASDETVLLLAAGELRRLAKLESVREARAQVEAALVIDYGHQLAGALAETRAAQAERDSAVARLALAREDGYPLLLVGLSLGTIVGLVFGMVAA